MTSRSQILPSSLMSLWGRRRSYEQFNTLTFWTVLSYFLNQRPSDSVDSIKAIRPDSTTWVEFNFYALNKRRRRSLWNIDMSNTFMVQSDSFHRSIRRRKGFGKYLSLVNHYYQWEDLGCSSGMWKLIILICNFQWILKTPKHWTIISNYLPLELQ